MVDAILLILREVLEATLIFTLLLVMSRKLAISINWVIPALLLGTSSSWLLAHYAYAIAEAIDGTGQEWMNACLYLLVVLSFIAIATIISSRLFNTSKNIGYINTENEFPRLRQRLLAFSMILAVGLSLAREVAEIWIYLEGFTHQPELLKSALIGGAIGLGVGISLGAIAYYLLVFISLRIFLYLLFLFFFFLCGGLSMQIARQFLQIGLLDSAEPLWDTSSVVNEHSWLGELLYALIGYDSSPSAVQVIFYWLAITPLIIMVLWQWFHRNRNHA